MKKRANAAAEVEETLAFFHIKKCAEDNAVLRQFEITVVLNNGMTGEKIVFVAQKMALLCLIIRL